METLAHEKQNQKAGSSSTPDNMSMASKYYPGKCIPTVYRADPFDPEADAKLLRDSLKGIATDGEAIIKLLSRRGNVQRLEIADKFQKMYGRDLIRYFQLELAGGFETAVVALMTPLPEYYAEEIHKAISSFGTDDHAIIESLMSLSNYGVSMISAAYKELYDYELEDDLKSNASNCYRRLLLSLCSANRNETADANEKCAINDAKRLVAAGQKIWETCRIIFTDILTTRSYSELRRIFQEYEKLSGHSLYEAIKREVTGDIDEEGHLAIMSCAFDKCAYFAERLRKAIAKKGTTDTTLIRIIVTRSEIDLGDIKETYRQMYGYPLGASIFGNEDYQNLLRALIG